MYSASVSLVPLIYTLLSTNLPVPLGASVRLPLFKVPIVPGTVNVPLFARVTVFVTVPAVPTAKFTTPPRNCCSVESVSNNNCEPSKDPPAM